MSLLLDFSDGWDSQTKGAIEEAVRKCIGDRPKSHNWRVSLVAGVLPNYYQVRIVTPNQVRSHMFFDEPATLPERIVDWINMYLT